MKIIHPRTTTASGYREPAVGQCDCGAHVTLQGFTNTCDRCGADYNMSGNRLADRAQWGEETGEHLADIERIGTQSAADLLNDPTEPPGPSHGSRRSHNP